MPTTTVRRRTARRPQLETATPLIAIAIARQVVEEVEVFLGQPLPGRYAAGLAHRARRIFAHSPRWRRYFGAAGDLGRDRLYVFMRHWLAARLKKERPALFARLPVRYAIGEPLAMPTIPVASTWVALRFSNKGVPCSNSN